MMDNHSIKLYIFLVLLPQTLWFLLSSHHGFLAVCEGCGFFSSAAFPRHRRDTSHVHQTSGGGECPANHGVADNLTTLLCSCEATREANEEAKEKLLSLTPVDGLGGWGIAHCLPDLTGPCTIKRRNSTLTLSQFLEEFAYTEPVVLTGMSNQEAFRTHSTKVRLLKDYGQELITIATANTHSYHKVQMTLCDYVEKVMKPQTYNSLGNETLYHFGDNDRERWDPLFSLYQLPSLPLPNKEPVLSFGLAGPGTGVPFHVHGPTYAETIYGRKRWFLHAPSHSPLFHPDETTLHWYTHTYPVIPEEQRPLECTLNPGEVLYLPDKWWHSTLNVDSVVFMSVFYS